jgi:hypothetical protein
MVQEILSFGKFRRTMNIFGRSIMETIFGKLFGGKLIFYGLAVFVEKAFPRRKVMLMEQFLRLGDSFGQ